VAFEQATIKVEKQKEFEELKAAIERAFAVERAEEFLKQVQRKSARVRDVEKIFSQAVIESVDPVLARSGNTAKGLYQALTVSDQAQMREFYLSKLEGVDEALRHKFKKLYQYY